MLPGFSAVGKGIKHINRQEKAAEGFRHSVLNMCNDNHFCFYMY